MENKWAFVSGATGGIGSACAEVLAKDGYHLILHYHQNSTKALKLKQKLTETYSVKCELFQADFADPDQVSKSFASYDFNVNVFLHCAGVSKPTLFQHIKVQSFEEELAIAVTTPMLLLQHLTSNFLRDQKGSIILISSIWGEVGAAMEVSYSTAKAAQLGFVKSLAKELAPSNIRVNAVSPGAIDTEMLAIYDEADKESIKEEIPLGRLGLAHEVANVVSFLASDKASYMTGQVVSVNGGWN
ncbi:SDR family oxidoreductase [Paenalkalicoccus suaedae]|uniref:SDR family oxidoreductase n=1 Tax=Paenalkalicoccus suaedae TaxID=2592382 RepID=A0A859FGP1_9BACI|nr:SDR family oxidoreductase [Paenalkalicoccus suaedae]QKS71375.1 SDR family oxidoreductase [Paenalkalicoccus suaedae]